jgi:hypothetical protein
MNLLTISRDEILQSLHDKQKAIDLLLKERDEAIALLAEKDRLDALNAQFGNITEEDIKQIREAQLLQAQAIVSEESVKLN